MEIVSFSIHRMIRNCYLNISSVQGGSKGFFAARTRAIYTKMHASAERIKITSPEVKCGVKSREPEIKSAGNVCF